MITYAHSLPPAEANALFRAWLLIPSCENGTPERLCAVAKQLAKLPPEEFTPANILKLAAPDLPIPAEIGNANGPLTARQIAAFYEPLENLKEQYADAHTNAGDRTIRKFQLSSVALMCDVGISYTDMKTCFDHPEKFSARMIPLTTYFSSADSIDMTADSAASQSLGDIHRQGDIVKIERVPGGVDLVLTEKLRTQAGQKEKLPGSEKTYKDEFRDQIADLCGRENTLQQQMVFFQISQNTAIPQTVITALMGSGRNPARFMDITVRRDQQTGDILVSKATDARLKFSLSLTVRIHPDGSQAVEGLNFRSGLLTDGGRPVDQMLLNIRSAEKDYIPNDDICRAMAFLDEDQTRLLAQFVQRKIEEAAGEPKNVDEASAVMRTLCEDGDCVAIFKALASVCATKSSAAVTRYLELLNEANAEMKGVDQVLAILAKEKPACLSSAADFATELNRRLGQGDRLTDEQLENLGGTIRSLSREYAQIFSEKNMGTAAGMVFTRNCEHLASQAIANLGDKLRGLTSDMEALKNEIESNLIYCGKMKSELVLSDEDVRVALFGALCTCSIKGKYDQATEPHVSVLDLLSARGEVRQVGMMDDDRLLTKIGETTQQIEDALKVFRDARDKVKRETLSAIKGLARGKFGLELSDRDISTVPVNEGLASLSLFVQDMESSVRNVFNSKVTSRLTNFAGDLEEMTEIPNGGVKGALFREVCKLDKVPDVNLRKLMPSMFRSYDAVRQLLDEHLRPIEEALAPVGDLTDENQINDRSTRLESHLKLLAQGLRLHIWMPFKNASRHPDNIADSDSALAGKFIGGIAEALGDRRLAPFANHILRSPVFDHWVRQHTGVENPDKTMLAEYRRYVSDITNFLAPFLANPAI